MAPSSRNAADVLAGHIGELATDAVRVQATWVERARLERDAHAQRAASLHGVARELFLELAPPELRLRRMRVETKVAFRTSREAASRIEARVVNASYLVEHAVSSERVCTIAMTVEQVPRSESSEKEIE